MTATSADAHTSEGTPGARRPWLACALQFAFLGAPIGGLGYLVRREWGRFGRAFAAVAALNLVVLAASLMDVKALSAVTMPLIFGIQAMSALDLYRRGK